MLLKKVTSLFFILLSFILLTCKDDSTSPQTYGTINGVITSEATNSPLSGVAVSCNGNLWTTSSDGTYNLYDIPTGTHNLIANKTGYVTFSTTINVVEGTNTRNIQLAISSSGQASISGVVKSVSTNTPISGVTVSCGGISATTLSDGNYQLDNVQIGMQTLTANKSGYEPYTTTINITPGIMTKDIELTTSIATTSVFGKVTDSETDQPLFNVAVTIAGMTDYTDASGNYSLPTVPQGQQTVIAELIDYDNFSGITYLSSGNKEYDIAMTWEMPKIDGGTASHSIGNPITQFIDLWGNTCSIPSDLQNIFNHNDHLNVVAFGVRDAKGIEKVEINYESFIVDFWNDINCSLELQPYGRYMFVRRILNNVGNNQYELDIDFYSNPWDVENIRNPSWGIIWQYTSPQIIVTDTDGNEVTFELNWQ